MAVKRKTTKAVAQSVAQSAAQRHFDVVIVGGGLAGAALAITASRLGLGVALIEAQSTESFACSLPERVIALSYGSRRHLHDLGVWEDIARQGAAPICKVHACEPGNRGEVGMHRGEADVEALGYVVQNAHVLSALYKAMPEGVRIFAPAQLQSLDVNDEHARVVIRLADGEITLHAALLVGADGTMSRVRKLSGIGSRGWDHNRFGLVASVTPKIPHHDVAHECFRAEGPLAFLPLDAGRYSIVWTLTPREAARIGELDDAAFLRWLEIAAGEEMRTHLGGFVEVGPRALFPFEYRVAESFTAQRVALIGNAAHTMHPVAGQGLNLGLRDVGSLHTALQRAVSGQRDIGAPVVLEEYAQQRSLDTTAVSVFTEGLNALFCNDLLPVKLARGMGMSGMDKLPALRRWLLRHAAGLAQQVSSRGSI